MFRYIRAMSLEKAAIQNKLLNAVDPLTEHLTKLYVFPNTDYKNHWRKEVWNFIHRVPLIKGRNKFPNYNFINNILSAYIDQLDSIMWNVIEDYSQHVPERYDSDELQSIVTDYMDWLSTGLSKNGQVSSIDVHSKLQELGL